MRIFTAALMAFMLLQSPANASQRMPDIPDEGDPWDKTSGSCSSGDLISDSLCSFFVAIGVGVYWIVAEGYPEFERSIFRPLRDKVIKEGDRVFDQAGNAATVAYHQAERLVDDTLEKGNLKISRHDLKLSRHDLKVSKGDIKKLLKW